MLLDLRESENRKEALPWDAAVAKDVVPKTGRESERKIDHRLSPID